MAPTRKPEKLEPNTVYSDREITAYFGVSKKFFGKLRREGRGPEYFQVGRSVRYWGKEVIIWMKMNARLSTVSHLATEQNKRKSSVFVGYTIGIDVRNLAQIRVAGNG